MSTVAMLVPGDVVTLAGRSATYIQQAPHPIWPQLRLVVWKLDDGTWSHDALDARQDVGEVEPVPYDQRIRNLRAALLGETAR